MNDPQSLPLCTPHWHAHSRERLLRFQLGEGFPTRDQLWRGAVLNTLVLVALGGLGSNTFEWHGRTCRLSQDADWGAVTFADEAVVGLFFFHEDERSPWDEGTRYDLRPFFVGMPPDLRALADAETAPLVAINIQEWGAFPLPEDIGDQPLRVNADGTQVPILTAALWGIGDRLTAAEPWPEVYEHGAILIENWLPGPEIAVTNQYGLSADQAARVWDLFSRWLARPDAPVILTHAEWQALEHEARSEHLAWLRANGWHHELFEAQRRGDERTHFEWARSMLAVVGIALQAE